MMKQFSGSTDKMDHEKKSSKAAGSRYDRTKSEMLVDLHIYLMPAHLWKTHQNSAAPRIADEAISEGYIRVHPESVLHDVRPEIEKQLGHDSIPRDYVFLRCIGRSFTRVKSKQEQELKVKYFLPPQTQGPELYLLDAVAAGGAGRSSATDSSVASLDTHHDITRRHLAVPNISISSRDEHKSDLDIEKELGIRHVPDEKAHHGVHGTPRYPSGDMEHHGAHGTPHYPSRGLESKEDSFDAELERQNLLKEVEKVHGRRKNLESDRNTLLQRAKELCHKGNKGQGNDTRDLWKKKYMEEKKHTGPKLEHAESLRRELDHLNDRIVGKLETMKDDFKHDTTDPEHKMKYEKVSNTITSTRLEQEIEDLQERLQTTKAKLSAETQLRNQKEKDLLLVKASNAQHEHFGPRDHVDHSHSDMRHTTTPHHAEHSLSLGRPAPAALNGIPYYREHTIHPGHLAHSNEHNHQGHGSAHQGYAQHSPGREIQYYRGETERGFHYPPGGYHLRDRSPTVHYEKEEIHHTSRDLHKDYPNEHKVKDHHNEHKVKDHHNEHKVKDHHNEHKVKDHHNEHKVNEHHNEHKVKDHHIESKVKGTYLSPRLSLHEGDEYGSHRGNWPQSHRGDDYGDDNHSPRGFHQSRLDGGHVRRNSNDSGGSPHHVKTRKSPSPRRKSNHSGDHEDQAPRSPGHHSLGDRHQSKSPHHSPNRSGPAPPYEHKFVMRKDPDVWSYEPPMSKEKTSPRGKGKKSRLRSPMTERAKANNLAGSFKMFATKDGGKEAANRDIVKWCADAGVLSKHLNSNHVDIAFAKVKPIGAKFISMRELNPLIDEMAVKYKEDKNCDLATARSKLSEKLANSCVKMHGTTNALNAGYLDRLTDHTKYTGTHKERFDASGKGKGIDGRENRIEYHGYVHNFKKQ